MRKAQSKYFRVLALTFSTRGVGFAVLEGDTLLVDWGVKSAGGDKNAECLGRSVKLIEHYPPDVIVLPNFATKSSRRSVRIRALGESMIKLAEGRGIEITFFSQDELRRIFFDDGLGTKHALAKVAAGRFPEELGRRLPPPRRPWMSEDYRMDIFDAVVLALAFVHKARYG